MASAAGARIDDELVTAVAELPPAVVRAALREVVDRRILIAAGGTADPHFVFRHALLQEVIHGDLFPGERARCHAGFALALEARAADRALGRSGGGPAPTAEELAYHWDAAGDDRRALAATIEAGRAAELVYAWLDAHRHYLRAIELWERVGDAAQPASIDRTELHGARRRDRHPDRAVPAGGRARTIRHRGRRSGRPAGPRGRPPRAPALVPVGSGRPGCGGRRAGRGRTAHPDPAAVRGARSDPRPQGRDPAVRRSSRGVDPGRRGGDIGGAGGRLRGGRGARARDPRLGAGAHRAGRRGCRPPAGRARHRRGDPQRGGHRARRHEPGHPARPGRPDRRCARRGRRRLGASPDDRRRADVRRPAAGDRSEGRHRPRSMG